MVNKPYYITTAIAYTSGKPHIGNTYEAILADAIARFKRKEGYDVFFQTGTDEHGQKIELKAAEAGITPKEFVDQTSAEIRRIWDLMDTSYDKFIRTTDPQHCEQVAKIFKKFRKKRKRQALPPKLSWTTLQGRSKVFGIWSTLRMTSSCVPRTSIT